VSPEILLAGVGVVALIAYAVLAGADFGGGVWDLFASGPRRDEQRRTVSEAMGPVWEANHVWLVFVIVILFSGFPLAYAALSVGLFLLFHLVLLGIILRGAAFVFRAYSPQSARALGPSSGALRWGAVFGASSVITPVLLGMSLGAVSSGAMRVDGARVYYEGTAPWLTPLAWAMGALALAICAYVAAVYLANETSGDLREDFRRWALISGTFVVGLSVVALPLLRLEARHLWEGLTGIHALPVLGVGAGAALLSGWALLVRRIRLARIATVAQVACLLLGWAIAQFPYIIYPDVSIFNAAAPRGTLLFILWSLPLGMAILIPSLWYLFRVFKGPYFGREEGRRSS
jgi:cytochrome bd ubiquinol oxidase subunit II